MSILKQDYDAKGGGGQGHDANFSMSVQQSFSLEQNCIPYSGKFSIFDNLLGNRLEEKVPLYNTVLNRYVLSSTFSMMLRAGGEG